MFSYRFASFPCCTFCKIADAIRVPQYKIIMKTNEKDFVEGSCRINNAPGLKKEKEKQEKLNGVMVRLADLGVS